MRMNLKVPFAEKDEAKKLGARWDAARKVWYVADAADPTPFAKWSPTAHDAAAPGASPAQGGSKTQQATGKVHVGSAYVERARQCDCLPWEVCEKCQPTSLKNNH